MRRSYLALLAVALIAPMPALGQVTLSAAPEMPPARGIATRAKPVVDPSQWIVDDDYPATARRAEQSGRTRFVLSIGVDGRVSACSVLESSNAVPLDEATCTLLKRRARFIPAHRKNGTALPDRWSGSVDWKMTDAMRPALRTSTDCNDCGSPIFSGDTTSPVPRGDPEQWLKRADCPRRLLKTGCAVIVDLTIWRSGRIRSCEIVESSGSPEWDREACTIIRRRARFERVYGGTSKRYGWEHRYTWPPNKR